MMSHIVPAFILLGFTLTVSLIVFVTEFCFGRKERGVGGQRDKRRHSREAWVEGARGKDLRGAREERVMVLRGIKDKLEIVSEGVEIEDNKIEVVRGGRGIEEQDFERERGKETYRKKGMENIGLDEDR